MIAPAAYALYLGIAAIAAACSNNAETVPDTGAPVPNDAGGVDDIPSTDDVSIGSDADAVKEAATVKDSVADLSVNPPDRFVEVGPDTAQAPTGCAAAFPLKGTSTLFATAPCGTGAIITDLDDNGLGICTDFQKKNMIFQLGSGKVVKSQALDYVPDQVDGTPDGDIAVTAMDGKTFANGILRFYGVAGTPSWLPFTPTTVDQKKFTPSFGKGVQFTSASLFVATGNIDFSKGAANYFPGSLLLYATGGITFKPLATKGFNPTSIGAWTDAGGAHLAVINTGALDASGAATSKSRLAVFNTDTPKLEQVFDLPFGGLGLAGELSIAGGRMAIPSADNSRRVIIVNTADLTAAPQVVTAPDSVPSKALHLIAFAKLWGQYLVAGDSNTGLVSVWSVEGASPLAVGNAIPVDKTLKQYSGIADAACIGGKLLVTVGPDVMELQ